jgi:two-component system, chemotaxis family, sensor kinase CheA
MSFDESELNEFRTEALELLDVIEKSLISLEAGGEFQSNYDAMFRVFHNLKGASGMMGLDELGKLMHKLENLLNSTKDIQTISREQVDTFFSGVDQAKILLGINSEAVAEETSLDLHSKDPLIKKPDEEKSQDGLSEFILEGQDICSRISADLQHIEKFGLLNENLDSLYRDVHTLKGGAYLFELKDLGELNHNIESVLDGLRQKQIDLNKSILDELYTSLELIEIYLLKLKDNSTSELSERFSKSICFFSLILSNQSKKNEAIKNDIEQKTEQNDTPTITVNSPQPQAVTANAGGGANASVSTSAGESEKESNSSIRVPVALLDKLMTLMGEMVLVRNQVIQYSNRTDDLEFLNLSQRLNVVTGEIQGEMMKTRMQPIGNVLSKFSRLTRELSKELGKKIEMKLSGSETELDKTLLEAVKDPLTHIVRNSCDHGIEVPAERKLAGKPEVGTISINSYHEGGQVIIEINDDGKGLHRDKLLQKAIEKGVISKERANSMPDNEVVNLIFAPGFSTAAKVTNVSGRGVGMDVVRTNIEKIGGSVEVQSVTGKGTTMRLKIPLTLAIVPAMIVRCESDYFAIPQLKLVELVRVDKSSDENKIEYIHGNPIYRMRGNILPLISIRKVLGLEENSIDQEVANIVVLKSEQCSFGLIVDDIQDTADIVVKPLARFLKPINVYSGATVLGDGAIALILDVAGIVQKHISQNSTAATTRSGIDSESAKRSLEDMQDFLLMRLGAPAKHGILLGYVHRLEEFKRSSIEISGQRRLIRYRDTVLPLLSVNKILGLDENLDINSEVISVVVVEKGGSYFGLEVNEILDVLTTESELDTTVVSENGAIGNLITDKEIIVILDPYKLINSAMGFAEKTSKMPPPQSGISNLQSEISYGSSTIKKILYVEDAAFFRRHVSKTLQSAGYEVTMANNGKEACELLDKSVDQAFDLILSDIEMPIMNGFEFAKTVRQNNRWKDTPLIALSTRSDQRHVDKGYQVGFNIYLEKMNAEELLQQIAQISATSAKNKSTSPRGVA